MIILLANDDGIYAPGLAALERELRQLGEVYVVAPATEQSGVGHAITYLTPLIVKEVYVGAQHWGWAVEGSPADCVKLGINQFCPQKPDLIVSGINYGLNAGINVLYSGTVAAAIEGAFYGITSVAVSLQFSEQAPFDKAAQLARQVIQSILKNKGPDPQLFNINIPTSAIGEATPLVRVVPMDTTRYAERFEKRLDPWGRDYYWATGLPTPPQGDIETDLSVLAKRCISVTPLDFNMTRRAALEEMAGWHFEVRPPETEPEKSTVAAGPNAKRPVVLPRRKHVAPIITRQPKNDPT